MNDETLDTPTALAILGVLLIAGGLLVLFGLGAALVASGAVLLWMGWVQHAWQHTPAAVAPTHERVTT